MSTQIKATLEKAIQDWADKGCEANDWQQLQVWWPESLTARMADAAYAVLMANHDGQKFAKDQDAQK